MALDEKFLPMHPHSICQVILSFTEGGIITPLREGVKKKQAYMAYKSRLNIKLKSID